MPSHPTSVIVIIEVVGLDKKEMVWMAKVSIEVHSGTARFTVAIKAQSIRRSLSLLEGGLASFKRYQREIPDPERLLVEGSAA